MGTCALTSADKRVVARRVGRDLLQHYGRKRYYSVPEVRSAARRQSLAVDWECWAYALYTDRVSFDRYHRDIGESCDYGAMHQNMIEAVGGDAASTLAVLDPSGSVGGLEAADDSWSIFDFFDWSDIDVDS